MARAAGAVRAATPASRAASRDTDRSSVLLGLRATSPVAARIAEDSDGEVDERLVVGTEIAVPTANRVERAPERYGQSFGFFVSRFEVDERPGEGLAVSTSPTSAREILFTVSLTPSRTLPIRKLSAMSPPAIGMLCPPHSRQTGRGRDRAEARLARRPSIWPRTAWRLRVRPRRGRVPVPGDL